MKTVQSEMPISAGSTGDSSLRTVLPHMSTDTPHWRRAPVELHEWFGQLRELALSPRVLQSASSSCSSSVRDNSPMVQLYTECFVTRPPGVGVDVNALRFREIRSVVCDLSFFSRVSYA